MANGTDEQALASIDDLSARTGRPTADLVLQERLRAASRRFRSAVGHPVHFVEDDVAHLDGRGTRSLPLPAVPVHSVSAVSIDGTPLAAGSWSVARASGILRRRNGVWPLEAEVTVTYSHGYTRDAIPLDIQEAVLQQAETMINTVAGVQSRTVLGDSIAFGTAATVGVTEDWSRAVRNHAIGLGDRS
jgi:hypothetical protein